MIPSYCDCRTQRYSKSEDQGADSIPLSTSVEESLLYVIAAAVLSKRQLPSDYLRAQQPQLRSPVSPVSPSQTPSYSDLDCPRKGVQKVMTQLPESLTAAAKKSCVPC